MNTLKNWLSNNKKGLWFIIGAVVVILLVIVVTGGGAGAFLSGTAVIGCDFSSIPQNTEQTKWGMIIVQNGMMLRTAPDTKAAELGRLSQCTIFEIKGRTADAQWLVIKVQGKTLEGWMANGQDYTGKWLLFSTDIATIPVSSATYAPQLSSSGGSSGGGSGGPIADNYISIGNGKISSGKITGLPANQPCNVTLYPAGAPNKAVVIWQGTISSDGTMSFQAPFPSNWSDGSQVNYGTLTIVFYVNGAAQKSLNLTYGQ